MLVDSFTVVTSIMASLTTKRSGHPPTDLLNAHEPRLSGLPLFSWLQIAFIVLGIGSMTIAYGLIK
ncbi:hypothetical protein OHA25_23070 [Nonomuraea sp. NBC_00507]|uniref:hypothetical protein n=1 Tax=Nonomuraea sp. NBC_00507 TaxID=2976002 RepID=UPI002E173CDE